MTNRDYFWDILKNSHRRLLWNYFAIVNTNVYFGDGFWTDFWRIFLLITVLLQNWLHQCWWRILEMKCVSYNFKMLVTGLVISVTNIHLRSTRSKTCHQYPKIVTNPSQPLTFVTNIDLATDRAMIRPAIINKKLNQSQ